MDIKKIKILIVVHLFFLTNIVFSQVVIQAEELNIIVTKLKNGIELSSINKGTLELLNTSSSKNIFTLEVSGEKISSEIGWNSVAIQNNISDYKLLFKKPINPNFSNTLTVTITIRTANNSSDWDISVTGIGNNTLNEVIFPQFNIKSGGDDYFLLPHYSGQLIKNPNSNHINSKLIYPLGWDASMQFSAYYNNNYGIYFGTHDPKASLKTFVTKAEDGGIKYENIIPIPNKSLKENDWEMSGVFQLSLFEGNWFDASQIYRNWVSNKADYWPKNNLNRTIRQKNIGGIGIWAYYASEPNYSLSEIEDEFKTFANYFNVCKVGIHWYQWNYLDFDNDYPNYFPELSGMDKLVKKIQQDSSIFIMPYINGRLFDMDLPNYRTDGYPFATKDLLGNVYVQNFNGNTFAVMCPTQKPWQNILVDASEQLTNRIGCSAIYLDQVCAATPNQCMDAKHNHTLGGGSWWREGYNEMFEKIHTALPINKFVTVEGGCDYLADEVDGFLVEGWTTNNLVPAFSAVYAGKVQLIGIKTGTDEYHNTAYYCKLSQAFAFGIQPGRASTWIVSDPNADVAKPFLKQLAILRYKLKDFLSFGRMLRQLKIKGTIPNITSTWIDYGENVDVTISALQHSVWQNKDDNKIALVFSNASMNSVLNFSFQFDGSDYEAFGKLNLEKITENNITYIGQKENSFSLNLSLKPLEVVAYIIKPDSLEADVNVNENMPEYKLEQSYPNPFNPTVVIPFTIQEEAYVKLTVYSVTGQKIKELVNEILTAGYYRKSFYASNLASGVYVYSITAIPLNPDKDSFFDAKKMILLK